MSWERTVCHDAGLETAITHGAQPTLTVQAVEAEMVVDNRMASIVRCRSYRPVVMY